MTLTGQVALITGAGSGIGRACAVALAEAGATVVCADIDAAAAQATADGIAAGQKRTLAVPVDVGDLGQIDAMVAQAMAAFGQIDIVVNNAGVTRSADIMDLTEADWDRIHRVNAKGVFFCLQRVAREMIPRRTGRIINIASIAGKGFRATSNAAYAASKGAVISLTYTASQQLAKHNINVNAICPGVTLTPLVSAMLRERARGLGVDVAAEEAKFVKDIPLRRANGPEDIAAMAVFLASPGARNITGQTYNVDGGLVHD
jgi:NAD(P)-dependent dehydrogenase (short-subunit alcohol dehydrogenase family)